MNIPGFTAEAALRGTIMRSRLTVALSVAISNAVQIADEGGIVHVNGEDIVMACGPCRCRVRGGRYPEVVCTKNCCSPRESGCDSWAFPCGWWDR